MHAWHIWVWVLWCFCTYIPAIRLYNMVHIPDVPMTWCNINKPSQVTKTSWVHAFARLNTVWWHTASCREEGRIKNLSTRAEDNNGNTGKTIKLTTEDNENMWICEIDMSSGSMCSHVQLQMLHFFSGCDIILGHYNSLFSVMRDNWINGTSAKIEEIQTSLRIGKAGNTLEIRRQILSWSLMSSLS